jgi:hypothetical protein
MAITVTGRAAGLLLFHLREGVVAKRKCGRYHSDGSTTSWLKIRSPLLTD